MADVELPGEHLDLADHVLAGLIGGMGLAGEHELHRAIRRRAAAVAAARVATAAAWLACKSRTGGRSRWSVRAGSSTRLAEIRQRTNDTRSARPLALRRPHTRAGAKLARRRPTTPSSAPSHTGPTLLDSRSAISVADPGMGVHAVGDRADRHLLDGDVGPHAVEHLAADRAVQLGDAVAATGEAQTHHRHVESVVVRLVGSLADRHQLVERDAQRRRRTRRSTSPSARAGSGRCRRAPACAW